MATAQTNPGYVIVAYPGTDDEDVLENVGKQLLRATLRKEVWGDKLPGIPLDIMYRRADGTLTTEF